MNIVVIALATSIVVIAYKLGRLTQRMDIRKEDK